MFHAILEKRRLALELTFEALAREITLNGYPVTKQTVWLWSQGKRSPFIKDPAKLQAIASALKISEGELLAQMGLNKEFSAHSIEAQYAADLVDRLDTQGKQKALRILEALAN